jgi:hypothetical protein
MICASQLIVLIPTENSKRFLIVFSRAATRSLQATLRCGQPLVKRCLETSTTGF